MDTWRPSTVWQRVGQSRVGPSGASGDDDKAQSACTCKETNMATDGNCLNEIVFRALGLFGVQVVTVVLVIC